MISSGAMAVKIRLIWPLIANAVANRARARAVSCATAANSCTA